MTFMTLVPEDEKVQKLILQIFSWGTLLGKRQQISRYHFPKTPSHLYAAQRVWPINSFMGSFLEFIFSNSPIYFLQILFIALFFWGAF